MSDINRVLIRKSDGYPIEFQSGNAPLGTLKRNAVSAGYSGSEIEEKYISTGEYRAIYNDKVMAEKAKKDQVKNARKSQAKERLKSKLKLNDQDIDDLKELLS